MSTFNINIPYTGAFDQEPLTSVQSTWASDLIYLGNDIFVGYVQQYTQGIGYIVVYEFSDLSNDTIYTNESLSFTNAKQQLLHIGNVGGVKLVKIAENRVMAIIDATVYILDFTGTDYVVSLTETNFFVNGMRTRANYNTGVGRGRNYMVESVKENEILIVDNETPSSNFYQINSQSDLKLYRVVYDPVGRTLTSTLKKDLSALISFPTLSSLRSFYFDGQIQRILGTNFVFINFSQDISDTTTTSRNTQSIVYSARCDLEGNELEIYPAPTTTRSTIYANGSLAWNAIALRSDLVVYHHNMSIAQILYQGDIYDTIPNGLLPENTSVNSAGPDMSFYPLDELHYLASWGSSATEYTAVFKVDSPLLINTRASNARGGLSIQRYSETPKSNARIRMNTIQRYDNNTFLLYTWYSFYAGNNPDKGPETNNEQYPLFRIRRISL